MIGAMYDIAPQVAQWLAEDRPVRVAQVVATKGFSSTDPSAAIAWSHGESVGGILPGLDRQLVGRADAGLVDAVVTDEEATADGLSCGGVARVYVQDAAGFPAETWERLRRREPVCLVHELGPGRSAVFTADNVRDATGLAPDIPRLFARGTSQTALFDDCAVVALWPPTTMLIVGDGAIAAALADVGSLLGWTTQISNDATKAAALAAELTESDAFVVLSHDREVDVPALESVLAGRAGYIGGLGSRHTQAARREGLLARGLDEAALARIHGPAGLDVDAHTPGEIAVSIVAEVLAVRSGSSGGSISQRSGPVHTSGVHAPPPRYGR
jgi:xanthine dehydrogenase accessory factor